MKVYLPGGLRVNRRLYVQPGVDHPETSEFMDKAGHEILFAVEFKNGVAETTGSLGRYLVDRKLAQDTPLILPERLVEVAA